jgi:hypothetical protein
MRHTRFPVDRLALVNPAHDSDFNPELGSDGAPALASVKRTVGTALDVDVRRSACPAPNLKSGKIGLPYHAILSTKP